GKILANGQAAPAGAAAGGGAGGGVALNVRALTGAGRIEASGGNGSAAGMGEGGSGGAISLVRTAMGTFLRSSVVAVGGVGATTNLNGAAGTVFARLVSATNGD